MSYKGGMSLGECVAAEECETSYSITIPEMKMSCIAFARDITNRSGGMYNPDEVLEIAKKYFDWIKE